MLAASVALLARLRHDRRATTAASGEGDATNLAITFLPKNLGNAYFDTSDAGGKEAIEEFGGTYAEVGPAEGRPTARSATSTRSPSRASAASPSRRTTRRRSATPSARLATPASRS